MNSATDNESAVLCTLEFHHREREESPFAEIRYPVSEVTHPPGAPDPVTDWGSHVRVVFREATHAKTVWSLSWLSAFWLALDYVRAFIPPEEERQWVDENGVEMCCLLPRTIPFSWGYDVYQKISRFSDDVEAEFVSDVERRRLERESRRGGSES